MLLLALALAAAPVQSVTGQKTGAHGLFEPSLRGTNVLIVMADDMSVDTLPIYGLDPSVPADLTPHLDALAARGVLFLNAYANPLCSPTRASVLTGMHAHRTGIGAVIESAQVSLPLWVTTLPELLLESSPLPYETAAFGKWHLEEKTSTVNCPSGRHGFGFFDGTLREIGNFQYCDWDELVCPSPAVPVNNTGYMLSELFDEAVSWIATRKDPWFCYFAPESPYQFPHVPPQSLQSIVSGSTCTPCDQYDRDCWNAAIQAFDAKLGELIASLGPKWWAHTTIVFTADNGTPNTMNTYWPNGSKGKLTEGGVHVPMIVAGAAVAPGRRGSTEDGLVQLTDLYRTVARLAGVTALPAGAGLDSVDLGPLLRSPPGGPVRQYAYAEKFDPNSNAGLPYLNHRITIRNTQFKLTWDQDEQVALGLYDLSVDPLETQNLLKPQLPPPGTPEGDALEELSAQIAAQLSS